MILFLSDIEVSIVWEYTDKAKNHFMNPRNVGEVDDPDGMAEVFSMACGDILRLTFKVDGDQRIVEARFKAAGCTSTIAAASALTEMITGITIEEAQKITNDNIAAYVGGLPPHKIHCSVLVQEALEKTIEAYKCKRSR